MGAGEWGAGRMPGSGRGEDVGDEVRVVVVLLLLREAATLEVGSEVVDPPRQQLLPQRFSPASLWSKLQQPTPWRLMRSRRRGRRGGGVGRGEGGVAGGGAKDGVGTVRRWRGFLGSGGEERAREGEGEGEGRRGEGEGEGRRGEGEGGRAHPW